jgi:oxaloacetate decarboxylase gamma subunit
MSSEVFVMGDGLDPLVLAGLELMLVGMGTVFVFLALLVFMVTLMSAMVSRFVTIEDPDSALVSQHNEATTIPAAHVAAITAAIDQHRNR